MKTDGDGAHGIFNIFTPTRHTLLVTMRWFLEILVSKKLT